MFSADFLLAPLEYFLNRFLESIPQRQERFEKLNGKVVGLELQGTGLIFYCIPGLHRLQITTRCTQPPNTWIKSPPFSLLHFFAQQASRQGVTMPGEQIIIEGDIETGQRFKSLFDGWSTDWEEQLSHYVGDIAAHQIGGLFRQVRDFGQQAASQMTENLTDYLREESQVIPRPEELAVFYTAVDDARDAAARLQARVERLERSYARTVNQQNSPL